MESLFNKVASLPGLQLHQQVILTQVLPSEYCGIFENTYLEEHLRTAASVRSGSYFFFSTCKINTLITSTVTKNLRNLKSKSSDATSSTW